MSDPMQDLILDLLEWIGPEARPYAEVMDAWRTSCPRLPVWEDANERGFIERHNEEGVGAFVSVTALGRDYLDQHRPRSRRGRGICMPSEIEYRLAHPSDVHDIANLHAQSWRENYRGVYLDAFLDGDLPGERLRVWRDRLDHPAGNQLVHVAVDGTQLVGFVCGYGAQDPQWGSFVDNLHVVRARKRNGVGAALMRQAGAWFVSRHPDLGVHLLVLEGNTSARQFYEFLGGRNAGVFMMETHGGAMVRSCRYVWSRAELLSPA